MAIDPEMPGRPSAETLQKITEFANKIAWRRPDLTVLKPEIKGQYPLIAEMMQQHILTSDWRKRLVLPDLRAFGNESVAIFTDYGGESSDAKFFTYSTLVCGWNLTHSFVQQMKTVRDQHGLGTKEIAFKDFGMGQVQRSLPGYLAALNLLPGFLFTLAVDRRLASLFGPQGKTTNEFIARALSDAGLGERKRPVNEKLLRIVHVAAFLAGLLTHNGQKIFWMTDHDAISASHEMHQKTLALFQRVLGLYARTGYNFPVVGGALPFVDRDLMTLDLLSATDIVAGSLDQYLTQKDSVSAADIRVKHGCDLVLQWLTHDGIGLKKMNVIVRPAENGTVEAASLEFRLATPPAGIFIPVLV